ncbi:MAG: hypothetical protein ACFFC9_13255 [Promethearchaeota archaeon]
MNRIEAKLGDTLNRFNFIFKNEEIYTECIKYNEGFSILGENFGPFEKGKKYKLKLFLARPFIENNILKVAPSEKCDNTDVQRYAIAERDDQRLIQQDNKYFLNKIKEFQYFMEKKVKDRVKPMIDLDRYNSYLSDIINSRLLKLLRLTKSKLSLDDEKRLTNSEKALFDIIYDYINTWRTFYLEKKQKETMR